MHIRALVATSIVALAASGASLAQETMADDLVTVSVAGSMVEVPVSVAAQACGMDAAAVIEASGMMNTDAKGADMVAAEPGTEAAAGAEPAAPTAVCEIDQATADRYGIPGTGEATGG